MKKSQPSSYAHVLDAYTRNEAGRIFLSEQKKFAQIPDLLEIQKQGFLSFIETYLHKLFEDINPIQDIA